MEQSTIGLIIMLMTIAALTVLRMPVAITLMLATAAMVVTGILPFSAAMSGFASSTCWLLIALMVAGAAIEKSG